MRNSKEQVLSLMDTPVLKNPFHTGNVITVPEGSTYGPDDFQSDEKVSQFLSIEVVQVSLVKPKNFSMTYRFPVVYFLDEQERKRSLLVTYGLIQANNDPEGRS